MSDQHIHVVPTDDLQEHEERIKRIDAAGDRYLAERKVEEQLAMARDALDKIVNISITTFEREPSYNQQSEIAREALTNIDEYLRGRL